LLLLAPVRGNLGNLENVRDDAMRSYRSAGARSLNNQWLRRESLGVKGNDIVTSMQLRKWMRCREAFVS
jgi:hypothetical protein